MNYQVPHFLETEQRIWGPFTFTKFVIMIGIAAVLWILYYLINFGGWILIAVVTVLATLALMFFTFNGRMLHRAFIDAVKHLFRSRRFTWAGVGQKENVSEFLLTKEKFRNLPSAGEAAKAQEKPVGERVEEITKLLDEQ